MVRVNLISPGKLADQHLIAEYNELLMLEGYVKKYPHLVGIPKDYCLGRGHILFFKDKLSYIKKRHEILKLEMKKRGFETRKTIDLSRFEKQLIKDWEPSQKDINLIKERIVWKINKKPHFYRYYGQKKSQKFFLDLINSEKV